MKINFKKTLSALLAAVMVLTSVAALDLSASAAEIKSNSAAVTEEDPVAVENHTVSSTANTEQKEKAASVGAPSTSPAATAATQPTTKAAPKVGNVKNVVKTSFESDRITLKWDKVSGATGYYIYYMNADSSKTFKKIATVKSTSATIKGLLSTTQYHFKISAYIQQDGVKYEGKTTLKKTATQPSTVGTVQLVRSSAMNEFKWSKNSKATGYKIYRACSKTNAKYVLYKTITNNKTTSFTDYNVEQGRAYYYRVYAYRNLYTNCTYTSKNSEIKFISGMSAPNYSMTSQLSRVSLTWKKNKYATGYDIYYATSRNGKYTKLGTTKNDYFNTVRLTNNKTYYFRVQPYKINGASKSKVLGTYTTKSKTVTNKAYGKSIGNRYIEISIKQQHMWFYIDGKLYCETDVVTGNDDGYHNTTKGAHKIFQRVSPAILVGANYRTKVQYWLGFTTSGMGIHDSTWRSNSEYGGTTYKGDGSHGCVNTPYNAVSKIYKKAKLGDYVVVY